jgi:hypothetical protein
MLSQKQEILIAESLSASVDTGASRCENFGNQPCQCGYCGIDGWLH